MKSTSLRILSGALLALVFVGNAAASPILTIDWSDLSHVKFTATGVASSIDYPSGGSNWTFLDGIGLLGFLKAPTEVKDIGTLAGASTLTDSNNDSANVFDGLSTWNDANPSFYPSNGQGVDLTLWSDKRIAFNFSTTGSAFYGEVVWDLSAYSDITALFPDLNATGNVEVWNGSGTLGTWQVVGAAAVPEPSTYALAGAVAFAGVALRRRKRRAV